MWLNGAFHKPDLRPLRDSLAALLRQVWGASPGQELLSEPVLCRETYSLQELARLSGQPIEALMKRFALRETSPVPMGLAESFLEALPALTVERCCEIFCTDPSILEALRSANPAEPLCTGSGWNTLSMQRTVDRLLLGVELLGELGWGWRALPQAAVELNCSLPKLIELLSTHDGTLRLGRLSRRFGVEAIVVNIQGKGGCETSSETFAEWQGIEPSEMLSFLRKGKSPSRITRWLKGRKDQILMTADDVADFHAKFISFRSLGLRLRKSWGDLDKLLNKKEIIPVDGCRQIYDLSTLKTLLT